MPDARLIAVETDNREAFRPLSSPTHAKEEDQDPWDRIAGVSFEENIFDSIVVSAFGGVTQSLAKTGRTLVHPFVLFLLSLPLLTTQVSTLMFFRLDQDLTRPVWIETETDIAFQRQLMLLTLKLLMIIVVQLILFGKILGTLRLLLFVLNPSSWDEIERPDPAEMVMKRGKWLFQRGYLWPCAFLAMLIHAAVNYTVCVDSVSIILASKSVKDAIYDSLAITFIADLPVTWWTVVATIFHFDNFGKFEFRLMDPAAAEARRAHSHVFTSLRLMQWMRRGYGARRLEVVISFVMLMLLYIRQVFVIVHALDTNVLPIARDVCTFWRWSTGQAQYLRLTAAVFRFFEQHFLVMDPTDIIDAIADPNGTNHTGFCNDTFDRLHWGDTGRLLIRYPRRMCIWLIFLVGVLCLPQIYYVTYIYIRPYFYDDEEDAMQDIPQQQKEVEDQIDELREEVRSIKMGQGQGGPGDGGGDVSASLQKDVQGLQQALDQERRDRAQELQALRAEMESLRQEAARGKKKRGFF